MRGRRIAVVGLAAVALAACGAGDDDKTAGSTTAGAPTSTPSTATATATGTAAPTPPSATDGPPSDGGGSDDDHGGGGGGDDGIDSVQWGPDDPPIPGEYLAFAVDGADGLVCGSINDRAAGDDFWTLAADVCRVFTGEGGWPDVGSVPAPSSDGNSYQRCLDRELFEMLERALAWHDEHPGQSPVVRYPSSGTHSPCQRSLYDVGPTDADVDPDDGCDNDGSLRVPTPGVPVIMSAPGITGYANPQATLDGALLCVIEDSQDNALRTFVVVVPTSGKEQTVTIDVDTNYGTLHTDVSLPTVDVETTEPSVVTTDDESPTESTGTTTTTDSGPGTTDDP